MNILKNIFISNWYKIKQKLEKFDEDYGNQEIQESIRLEMFPEGFIDDINNLNLIEEQLNWRQILKKRKIWFVKNGMSDPWEFLVK